MRIAIWFLLCVWPLQLFREQRNQRAKEKENHQNQPNLNQQSKSQQGRVLRQKRVETLGNLARGANQRNQKGVEKARNHANVKTWTGKEKENLPSHPSHLSQLNQKYVAVKLKENLVRSLWKYQDLGDRCQNQEVSV